MTMTLKRRRVTMTCIACGRAFRYMYSGTGPYRNYCPRCTSVRRAD